MRTPVYEKIRKYMNDRDVSRKVVAMNLGITESKLSLMLSGKRRLTIEEYLDVCRVLAVSPKLFIEEGESA